MDQLLPANAISPIINDCLHLMHHHETSTSPVDSTVEHLALFGSKFRVMPSTTKFMISIKD